MSEWQEPKRGRSACLWLRVPHRWGCIICRLESRFYFLEGSLLAGCLHSSPCAHLHGTWWSSQVMVGPPQISYLRQSWAKATVPFVISSQRSLCHLLHDLWVRNRGTSSRPHSKGEGSGPSVWREHQETTLEKRGEGVKRIWARHLFPICSWKMVRYVCVFLH